MLYTDAVIVMFQNAAKTKLKCSVEYENNRCNHLQIICTSSLVNLVSNIVSNIETKEIHFVHFI